MPSPEDIAWAITIVAKRERAAFRFRLILMGVPFAAGAVAMAATELRMDELLPLVAVVTVLGLVVAAITLLRAPPRADVERAWAVLREVAEGLGGDPP